MMISSSLERNRAISHLCKEIISSNDHIYFVASINKNGKVVESEIRNDRIITNMNKQEIEMLFMQRVLQTNLGMELNEVMGPMSSITIHRETLIEIIVPYSYGILFVICYLEVIPRFISKKISLMLQDFDWRSNTIICE